MCLQRCLNNVSINYAYQQAQNISVGWENRIRVKDECFYRGPIETNYVMFKYIVDNIEKICLCIVIDNQIVRVVNIDLTF